MPDDLPLESKITRYIFEYAARDWASISSTDVVIVGAGPAGMTAARYLAEKGLRVVVFERRLSFGGGIGGGGMLLHKLLVHRSAEQILEDFKINYTLVEGDEELFVVDTAEFMAKLAAGAIEAGAKVVLGVHVDDVIIRTNPLRVTGVAVQWSAVIMAGLHVDPLFVYSKAVIDATGHDAEILSIVSRKVPGFNIVVPGEMSAYAEEGERLVVEKTGRVVPGLYVAGMAVGAYHQTPRMGPIFSSMLLSGKKVAEIVAKDLESV